MPRYSPIGLEDTREFSSRSIQELIGPEYSILELEEERKELLSEIHKIDIEIEMVKDEVGLNPELLIERLEATQNLRRKKEALKSKLITLNESLRIKKEKIRGREESDRNLRSERVFDEIKRKEDERFRRTKAFQDIIESGGADEDDADDLI